MKPATPPREFPPGYFTEPVRAWKGMRFESQIVVDPRTKKFITDYARAQALREGGGWNVNKLNLPGTPKT